ncbi:urease accessory protein UreF [Microvirga rosea]|uniref:urease accessory protein UreF n=1 Tax=Microvirga rosea TaxID=2715425 RepID=UPI001D09A078|nr:urease accessory protein UreF [Microvirga rosea]MCB8822032.1 urease accessory protein UreF [Microvirga rosea]
MSTESLTMDDAVTKDRVAALARMLQFGDSMFPIGGFSFSSGLESAVQKGVVTDVSTLLAFTRTATEQAARGDGIAVIAAHRAAMVGDVKELICIDESVYARKLSDEARTMSVRMGKKFAEMGVHVLGAPLLHAWRDCILTGQGPGCYPVALAVNFAVQDLSEHHTFAVHQYGVAAPILGAALRLMKVSHLDTQKILYELSEDLDAAYERAAKTRLMDMSGYAPLMDILAAVHIKAHVRLFMN